MKDKSDVQLHVLNYLHSFTGISADDFVKKGYLNNKLTDNPPNFDSTSLTFLAQALRGYIKNSNSNKTILVSELNANGLTVSGLINLVYDKI